MRQVLGLEENALHVSTAPILPVYGVHQDDSPHSHLLSVCFGRHARFDLSMHLPIFLDHPLIDDANTF